MSFGFSYNPAGQITSRTSNNDVYAFTGFTNQNVIDTINGRNQVTATGATSVSHDARGNITAVGSDSYGYDEINRLVSAPSTTLTYDPSGRLYQSAGSTTVRYAYDGASPSAEYDGSSNLQRRYVDGPGLDEPLVRYEGTGLSDRRWYVADERGSVLAETGGTGSANYVNRYGAYGEPAPSNSGRFGYTGHVWLADAELNHARNRAYNPELGRFMQTDPIGQNGGTNIYGYVDGDPMNFTDPWGLFGWNNEDDDPCDPRDNAQTPCSIAVIGYCPSGRACMSGEEALLYLADVFRQMYNWRDFDYPLEPMAVLRNGELEWVEVRVQEYQCDNGTSYVAVVPSAPLSMSGVSAVFHGHPPQWAEPFPGPGDGRVPANHGISNVGVSNRGVWAVHRDGGRLGTLLLRGSYGRGFNRTQYERSINRGRGDANAGSGVSCQAVGN